MRERRRDRTLPRVGCAAKGWLASSTGRTCLCNAGVAQCAACPERALGLFDSSWSGCCSPANGGTGAPAAPRAGRPEMPARRPTRSVGHIAPPRDTRKKRAARHCVSPLCDVVRRNAARADFRRCKTADDGIEKPDDDLLSHEETSHYHRRGAVSLLSSGRDQVVPARYGRQARG